MQTIFLKYDNFVVAVVHKKHERYEKTCALNQFDWMHMPSLHCPWSGFRATAILIYFSSSSGDQETSSSHTHTRNNWKVSKSATAHNGTRHHHLIGSHRSSRRHVATSNFTLFVPVKMSVLSSLAVFTRVYQPSHCLSQSPTRVATYASVPTEPWLKLNPPPSNHG